MKRGFNRWLAKSGYDPLDPPFWLVIPINFLFDTDMYWEERIKLHWNNERKEE